MYEEIPLNKITPNPHNTRTRFEGTKFDELVQSIAKRGVIEPIIVRKVDAGYEIVAGERRFRASLQVHHGNGHGATIPALVRDLTDEEAIEFMTIENLQRENLTELEEARAFQHYLSVKGEDAAEELAQKIGVDPRYVRRRVRVLSLPKKALDMWEQGELRYGHLEQFLRLGTKGEVLEILDRGIIYSVDQLRSDIDRRSPQIAKALFDTKKAGCQKCAHNSSRQRSLFGDVCKTDNPLCLSPTCFAKRQGDHLAKTWDREKFGTASFRWRSELPHDDCAIIWSKPHKACRECEKCVTAMEIDGRVSQEHVCLDKSCHRTTYSSKAPSAGGEKKPAGAPSWHATFFREEFYKERIPVVAAPIPPDSCQLLHATLVAILEANTQAFRAFARKAGKRDTDFIHVKDLWPQIQALGSDETKEAIKEATVNMVLQGTRGEGTNFYINGYSIGPHMRHVLAAHLGIELALDWRLSEEYLRKKTIAEVLAIGHRGGLQHATSIFDDPKAKAYLLGTLKRKTPEACKKTELIDLILKSGVDLAGRVPDEILKEKDDQS
jgi:ParB family chromosome partitioning protein